MQSIHVSPVARLTVILALIAVTGGVSLAQRFGVVEGAGAGIRVPPETSTTARSLSASGCSVATGRTGRHRLEHRLPVWRDQPAHAALGPHQGAR